MCNPKLSNLRFQIQMNERENATDVQMRHADGYSLRPHAVTTKLKNRRVIQNNRMIVLDSPWQAGYRGNRGETG